jgi:imidazoleglycerol-phosphate dehydratase
VKKRTSKIKRKTKETDIELELTLDGTGFYTIDTPIPFLNHMLDLFAKHGLFDLNVKANGDVDVDDHHLVEDLAIVLGEAFLEALGDKKGINRYGSFQVPMDEAAASVLVDFSNRACLVYESPLKKGTIKNFDIELVTHFLESLTQSAKINLHVVVLRGDNKHHIVEAIFKALGRSFDQASQIDVRRNDIPSTKGTL